jgi:hypothetical protein
MASARFWDPAYASQPTQIQMQVTMAVGGQQTMRTSLRIA